MKLVNPRFIRLGVGSILRSARGAGMEPRVYLMQSLHGIPDTAKNWHTATRYYLPPYRYFTRSIRPVLRRSHEAG